MCEVGVCVCGGGGGECVRVRVCGKPLLVVASVLAMAISIKKCRHRIEAGSGILLLQNIFQITAEVSLEKKEIKTELSQRRKKTQNNGLIKISLRLKYLAKKG